MTAEQAAAMHATDSTVFHITLHTDDPCDLLPQAVQGEASR